MDFRISPLLPEQANELIGWTYDPPYDGYDLSPDQLDNLLLPEYRYHAILNNTGDLIGYCCYGIDGQVPGGDYSRGEPEVLDFGIGLRPDLTGKGMGGEFVREIMDYAIDAYQPQILRVTVATFNSRSLRVFRSLGFKETFQFTRDLVDIKFIQLEKMLI
jgi:RimJ/RimL family protein N-acetyltransferase